MDLRLIVYIRTLQIDLHYYGTDDCALLMQCLTSVIKTAPALENRRLLRQYLNAAKALKQLETYWSHFNSIDPGSESFSV